MTDVNLNIHVNADEVMQVIDRINQKLSGAGLSEYMVSVVAPFFKQRAANRFAAEGDSASGQWAALKWPTQVTRVLMGYFPDHPINVRSGNLRDWMVANDGEITKISAASAQLTWPGDVGGELEAKFTTAQAGKGDPPTVARPVAAADDADLMWILSGLQHWVESP